MVDWYHARLRHAWHYRNILKSMAGAYDALGERQQAITYASASLDIFSENNDPAASRVSEQLAQWRECK